MSEARSVLGVICSAYDSFFEAEKKIADYIMEHKEQAVDMTVGELAKASGTSDATVSRFCRRCGFKGFQNLKLTLAREILEEEHQSQEVTNDIDRTDLEQSLKNILANKIAELTETIKMMDIKNLEVILDKLEHARMVQLAAVGNTIPVALDGAFKLNQLGIPAVAGDIWEAQAAYAFNLGPEDVVLFVSYSGATRDMLETLRAAKAAGAKIILLTHYEDSPGAKLADIVLLCGAQESPLDSGNIPVKVALLYVAEVLVLRYTMDDPENANAAQDRTSEALAVKML